jgi:hypothetical protein
VLSFVVHTWRKRVLKEEPNHLAGSIGSPRKGVGTGGAATRPSVTGPMNDPLFYHCLAAGIGMQHAAVRESTRYLSFFDPPPEQPRRRGPAIGRPRPSSLIGFQ